MDTKTIAKFSDFAKEGYNLSGEKIPMSMLFDREVVIKAYRFMESKAVRGKECMQLQLELDGREFIAFTTSTILQRQMRQYEDHLPFLTTIKNMGRYHTFS